jgi:hypothetical protein|tara:strand:+ start:346 stop:555 length:210 start_codon:yes stop_codon:yes gene_type:complete
LESTDQQPHTIMGGMSSKSAMGASLLFGAIPLEIGVVAIGASIAISISIGVAVLFERWKQQKNNDDAQP